MSSNQEAVKLLEENGMAEQARILRSLESLDLRISNEVAINDFDLEKIFESLSSLADSLDLWRTKLVLSELNLHSLASDYFGN